MKLEIEPIPSCNWGQNLASLLPKPVWDTLRREVYAQYDHKCAICGNQYRTLFAHEKWVYDNRRRIQFLKGFICVCNVCSDCIHWGRTVVMVHQGKMPQDYLIKLAKHFCEVNSCSQETFELHKAEVGLLNERRNRYRYHIEWGKYSPERLTKKWKNMQDRKS